MTGVQTCALPISEGDILKTKLHTIEFSTSNVPKLSVKGKSITFYSPDFQNSKVQAAIEELLTKIYRKEAHLLLPDRLKKLASEHGFCFSNISIRNNRRNWGSCSSRNNISLNLQMMKLPDHLIDYILLHELVHTEIKDHSDRFWNRLDQLTQNRARDLAKQVKKFSTYTL